MFFLEKALKLDSALIFAAAKDVGQAFVPVGEDGLHISTDAQALDQPSQRNLIPNPVFDLCSTVAEREVVLVVPAKVRPPELTIDKEPGWLPCSDFRAPPHGQTAPAQSIVDGRAHRHRDGFRGQNGKPQPRWGDLLEIACVREEGKELIHGPRQPSSAGQKPTRHRVSVSAARAMLLTIPENMILWIG